jgi:acetyl esterase/lipase
MVLANGRNFLVPTPDGRELKARIFGEDMKDPKGVFYHIHGGGNVFGSCAK